MSFSDITKVLWRSICCDSIHTDSNE